MIIMIMIMIIIIIIERTLKILQAVSYSQKNCRETGEG